MSEEKAMHAAEPWRKGKNGGSIVSDDPSGGYAGGGDGVEYYGGYLVGESITDVNLERVIACVNACAGIPTEKLAGKTIKEYVSEEAFLSGMEIHDGVNIGLTGLACQMLTSSFAGQFVGNGGINYLQMTLTHEELGAFTVTIQRQRGKTPAELQKDAEAQRDALLEAIESVFLGSQTPDGSGRFDDGMVNGVNFDAVINSAGVGMFPRWYCVVRDALDAAGGVHGQS